MSSVWEDLERDNCDRCLNEFNKSELTEIEDVFGPVNLFCPKCLKELRQDE